MVESALCRRIGPFEEMLRVTAYLFNLPDTDFTVSYGDNQCCNRPWLAYTTAATDASCGAFLIPSYRLWQHVSIPVPHFILSAVGSAKHL